MLSSSILVTCIRTALVSLNVLSIGNQAALKSSKRNCIIAGGQASAPATFMYLHRVQLNLRLKRLFRVEERRWLKLEVKAPRTGLGVGGPGFPGLKTWATERNEVRQPRL